MVFSSSRVITVAIATAAASATATTMVDQSLLKLENSTTPHGEVQPLLEAAPRSLIIVSLCNVDLVGGDIWQAQHKTPDLCVSNCLAETGCDAATWTDFNGGTCFFKSLWGSWANSVPKMGAISFMRVDTRSQYMDLKPNFPANADMPGNDAKNVPSPTQEECYRILYGSLEYAAATWTNYQGGTCWLKSKVSPYAPAPGAFSAYVPRFGYPNKCL